MTPENKKKLKVLYTGFGAGTIATATMINIFSEKNMKKEVFLGAMTAGALIILIAALIKIEPEQKQTNK